MKNPIKSCFLSIPLSAAVIFTLMMLTACGAKDSGEAEAVAEEGKAAVAETAEASETEKSVEEQIEEEIAELRSRYMYIEEETLMTVSQPGNYIIDGVELCDAVEASQEPDDTWEGYSEEELGFLKPDRMPNCLSGERDCHFVSYDGVLYVYVNDYNSAFGEKSIYTEYANVWCSTEDGRVLGGLEEYGRKCAQEKGEAE